MHAKNKKINRGIPHTEKRIVVFSPEKKNVPGKEELGEDMMFALKYLKVCHGREAFHLPTHRMRDYIPRRAISGPREGATSKRQSSPRAEWLPAHRAVCRWANPSTAWVPARSKPKTGFMHRSGAERQPHGRLRSRGESAFVGEHVRLPSAPGAMQKGSLENWKCFSVSFWAPRWKDVFGIPGRDLAATRRDE